MNRLQKMAWINLAGLGAILIASVVLLVYIIVMDGTGDISEHLSGLSSLWMMATLAVMISSEWWAKRQHPGRVKFDERDGLIQIKALLRGMLGFLGVFLWMLWLIVPSTGLVSTWIPILLGSAAMAGNLVYSIAILVQYGRGGKDGEK